MQAGDDRLRPINMTAACTILGLVPLAVGKTALLGLSYYPLARAVIGGLGASTVLTLIVLPFVYSLFDDAAAGDAASGCSRANPRQSRPRLKPQLAGRR